MFDNKDLKVNLPQPVKCHCEKGYLLPIIRPVTIKVRTFNTPVYEAWGEKYQIIWQCSFCTVLIVGEPKKGL